MFISNVIKKIIALDEFGVGKLDIRKNFIYVDDAVSAIKLAINSPSLARNNVYNIGGELRSLKEILRTIRYIFSQKLNKKVKIKYDPSLVRKARAEVNPFGLSTAKAAKALRWRQKTSLEKGLDKTIDYFLSC